MTENISGLILPNDRVTHGESSQPQLCITEFSDGTKVFEAQYGDFFKEPSLVVSLPAGEEAGEVAPPRPYRPFTDRLAALALDEFNDLGHLPQWFIDAHSRG